MADINDDVDTLNNDQDVDTTDTTVDTDTDDTNDTDTDDENIDWEARSKKNETLANNYKVRAEKAEGKLKGNKVAPSDTRTTPKQPNLSTSDLYALMNAKVAEEDIADVAEYAALKKISVAEALKLNVVKTILADKSEARNVADATNTSPSRRVSSKSNGENMLKKASEQGVLPDSEDDLVTMIKTRKGIK